jgi:ankyrin repeat protein
MLLRELARFAPETATGQEKVRQWTDNYFNRRYLFEEPSIRDFLVEMIAIPSRPSWSMSSQDDHDWKKNLLSVIESSKSHPPISVACGNAITVLLLLGHSFAGSDLREIRCAGAVFDNGDFRGVNFRGAVFEDCSWDGCLLDDCDFGECDFTNSNLIEERSTLRDLPSPVTSLLNLNGSGVVVASSASGSSIWVASTLVKRDKDKEREEDTPKMKACDLYASPSENWVLVSGGGKGYLYRTNDLRRVWWTVDDLNCVQDAIALTDDEIFFGATCISKTDSAERCVDLFRVKLPTALDVSFDESHADRLKVNNQEMRELTGVKVNITDSALLFVYCVDSLNWETCRVFSFLPNKSQYQLSASVQMELIRFDLIPSMPLLFCWANNRLPFLLHLSPTSITRCSVDLPFLTQAHDSCMSHNGSSMLLGGADAGFLCSLLRNEPTDLHLSPSHHLSPSPSPVTITKLLQVEGMTGPFSASQFSADCELVCLACGSEVCVVRVKGCQYMQVIRLNLDLARVSFNQRDQELLIVARDSSEIIRRRVELRDEMAPSHWNSISNSIEKKLSCVGSNVINASGLSPEDKSLLMERGGIFVSEQELISQYRACGLDDEETRAGLVKEALRSQYRDFVRLLKGDENFKQRHWSKSIMHEVVSLEYFDGSYGEYLLFLDEGSPLEGVNEDGDTILLRLSCKGHKKTLEKLLRKGSRNRDVNQQNRIGVTPLFVASQNGHEEVCALLLSHGASVNQATDNGATPLSIASENGHEGVCALLLSHGASVNQATNDGFTPLTVASQNGRPGVCALLLSHGASVNQATKDGATPVYAASLNGHEGVCELLLSHGASVTQSTTDGFTSLYVASQNGHEGVCSLLLSHSASVNQADNDGFTPLCLASQNGHEGVCALLLSHGASINQTTNDGATPLSVASENGHGEVCALLLSHGALVNQTDNDGFTPLFVASQNGHEGVCALLLSHGASINQTTNDGATPLSIASENGHEGVCALLLSHGASVNQATNDGATPLYDASENGHQRVCALLLSHGASVNQATKYGATPLSIASENGHEEVCALLLSHGAINKSD